MTVLPPGGIAAEAGNGGEVVEDHVVGAERLAHGAVLRTTLMFTGALTPRREITRRSQVP